GQVALTRTDAADSPGCGGTVAALEEPFQLVVSDLIVTISFTAPGAVPAIGSTDAADAFTASGGGQTWSGRLTDPSWIYKISEAAPLSCSYSAAVTFNP